MILHQQRVVIRRRMNTHTVHSPVGHLYKEQQHFLISVQEFKLVRYYLKLSIPPVLASFPVALAKSPDGSHRGEKGFAWLSSRPQSIMAKKSQLELSQACSERSTQSEGSASSAQVTFFSTKPGLSL